MKRFFQDIRPTTDESRRLKQGIGMICSGRTAIATMASRTHWGDVRKQLIDLVEEANQTQLRLEGVLLMVVDREAGQEAAP